MSFSRSSISHLPDIDDVHLERFLSPPTIKTHHRGGHKDEAPKDYFNRHNNATPEGQDATLDVPDPLETDGLFHPARDYMSSSIFKPLTPGLGGRLITLKGGLNIHRASAPVSLYFADPFHTLVDMPWVRLLSFVVGCTFLLWCFFAFLYMSCGNTCLSGHNTGLARIFDYFFFSVQTQTTIGFGDMIPTSMLSNWIFVLQSIIGILWQSSIFGLIYTKFSRPTSRSESILFSDLAIISKRDGILSLQLRVLNLRKHQVVDPQIDIIFAHEACTLEGEPHIKFQILDIPDHCQPFIALPWTVVHPVKEDSPLYGKTLAWWESTHAELLVIFRGIDAVTNGTFQARKSYTVNELRFGRLRFADAYHRDPETSMMTVDLRSFHDIIYTTHPTSPQEMSRSPSSCNLYAEDDVKTVIPDLELPYHRES
eukprot:TRINITY_DN1390_c1_g1_i5.p1 TRINITY_DN1390_c1_g1~~TRINITY_DN1390_c1_g1_i5.p1  ORF type:complete len:425 (+),score=78.70 TRINITY_DN1390_c1_g1_i5:1234-2508(+)